MQVQWAAAVEKKLLHQPCTLQAQTDLHYVKRMLDVQAQWAAAVEEENKLLQQQQARLDADVAAMQARLQYLI